MKQENKEVAEFGIGDLDSVAITIAVLVLVIAFVLNALVETRDGFEVAGCNSTTNVNCTYEYNATQDGINALGSMTSKVGLIVTIVMIVVVIGALALLKRN